MGSSEDHAYRLLNDYANGFMVSQVGYSLLRWADHLKSGVRDQPDPHRETPISTKNTKLDAFMSFAGTWIKLETIILSKLSQGQKTKHRGAGALAKECMSLYPGCKITVFDVPEVVWTAKQHFSFQEEEQIDFQEGDFFKDPLPEADLYILARVLHDWADGKCSHLLERIYHTCKPGGGILVIESLLDEDRRGPLLTQLYSLNMLVQTEGQERTPTHYHMLLSSAGFRDFQFKKTGAIYDAILARK
uniref:Acetylserotonin O-methyltransferase n=1 Tax=Gorilla gorilla gorilla TaxID=9595 RepID=G3QKC8_GORGO